MTSDLVPMVEILSTEPLSLKLFLPGVPMATNRLLGYGFRKSYGNKMRWYKLVSLALRGFKPEKPLEKAHIKIIRHANRMLDYDGCVASMKPVVDALVRNKIIIDDRWSVTGIWDVDQKFRPKKEGSYLELEIMGVSAKSIDHRKDGHVHVIPNFGPEHDENERCWCQPEWNPKNRAEYVRGEARLKCFVHRTVKELEQ